MGGLWANFLRAWTLLTRVPLPRRWFPASLPPPVRCVWCFPVVGALIGAGGGALYAILLELGLPAGLAGLWTLAGLLLGTGALHEDGLADVADGFGGGRDRPEKLAIMRDSRIGSYGVLALLLAVAMRATAIATLREPHSVAAALVGAGTLGRGAILIVLARIPPARKDGLAAPLRDARLSVLGSGLALAALVSLAALPVQAAVAASAIAALCGLGAAGLARGQIGGHTGDVLGAAEQVTECAVLTVLAALAG
jgi:adenosylcobinamide-GDP ribazoletransferase